MLTNFVFSNSFILLKINFSPNSKFKKRKLLKKHDKMDKKFLELRIKYHNSWKLVIYEEMDLTSLIAFLKQVFKIPVQDEVALMDITYNAEITSARSLSEDRPIQILLLKENEASYEPPTKDNQKRESKKEILNNQESLTIPLDDIKKKTFEEHQLLVGISKWSEIYRFQVVFGEGKKTLANGFKRIVCCNKKNCSFKLTFKSDKQGIIFTLDEEVSQKNNKHSTFFPIIFIQFLDHQLTCKDKSLFNKQIDQEMFLLMGKTKTIQLLMEIINKKFATKFNLEQIKYRVLKLLNSNRHPDNDAYDFVEIAKNCPNSFFSYELDEENRFQKSLFLSDVMLIYSSKFLDIVIIDSTYKRNRFNLILVNIIGIDNYGRNIMLGFGLLDNETSLSYEWLFRELKKNWNESPLNFVVDECDSIKNGNIFLI